MDKIKQERMMQSIFGAMMVGGHLRNQSQMAKELKAIHYLLKTQEHLSEQECDDCLFYFSKNTYKVVASQYQTHTLKQI